MTEEIIDAYNNDSHFQWLMCMASTFLQTDDKGLATILGVPVQTIHSWKDGRVVPSCVLRRRVVDTVLEIMQTSGE
jgi:hypothetical protein